MARIAFCGLGQMGEPMAMRLVSAGHDVAVWNRTASKAAGLVARGARLAATPADAARDVDVAFTMVATPDALRDVVLGSHGLAGGLRRGAVLVDMSTVGRAAVEELAGALLSSGVGLVDAPVLGSVPQARDGALQIYFGGDAEVLERLRPLLSVLGTVRHVGPRGAGAALKLAMNSTLGAAMCAIGEALALAQALGIDRGVALDALEQSPLGMTVKRKRPMFETGDYPANFQLSLAAKDLRLVNEAAKGAGLQLPLAEQARSTLEAALQGGSGQLDYAAVVAHICGWSARSPGR